MGRGQIEYVSLSEVAGSFMICLGICILLSRHMSILHSVNALIVMFVTVITTAILYY